MLIRNAEVHGLGLADLRIAGDRIAAIGALPLIDGETVIEAGGGLLLPGLHDHHIHLAALAARRASIDCGPSAVTDAEGLVRVLRGASPGTGWLRGIGFHESVLGGTLPDAPALDAIVSGRPVRLQHRTGRMWLFNSLALDTLLAASPPPPGLERKDGHYTGRLFDEDAWLQAALASRPPDLGEISADLARYGVTGLTDMSPRNDARMAQHFTQQRSDGRLLQSLIAAGSLELADAAPDGWQLGPLKLHLHEAALPDFDEAVDFVRAGHAQGRAVAVHCVTEVELVFALAAIEAAGTHPGAHPGDRIEHVSVAAPDLVARMAQLGLWACVQPHFIAERGDTYLAEVEARHQPDLYRLRSLHAAGIAMAGGSDAPYGSADPWAAMAAAVRRQTSRGAVIGPDEALSPEDALALYLADPLDLARTRTLTVGAPADLCLLDHPWAQVRNALSSASVRATLASGRIVHQSIDEPPLVRERSTDAAA